MGTNPIYHLTFSTTGCTATATLNGFPVLQSNVAQPGFTSLPANPLLVGKGNRIVVEVAERTEDATLEGGVQIAGEGDFVTAGGGPIALPEGPAPLTIEHAFDTDVAVFRQLLDAARPLADSEVRAFGIELRDRARDADGAALARLFEPKLADYAAAFGVDPARMRAELGPVLEAVPGAELDFEEADLEAVPHCDGRVFEVKRSGERSLFRIVQDDSSHEIPVFVADCGDGMRIVR